MHRSSILGFIFLLACFQSNFLLQGQAKLTNHKVKHAIRKLANQQTLKSASISFSLLDLRSGKLTAAYDEYRALLPASSQKIITCAFLLNEYSKDYRYVTSFTLHGNIKRNGVFAGDLVITGSGDPSFASDYFPQSPGVDKIADTIAAFLKFKGIHTIEGKIKFDENFIEDVPENKEWLWYDLGNYYGAGCRSFNFSENQVRIQIASAEQENQICPLIRIQPAFLKSFYTCKVIGKNQVSDEIYVLGNSQSCNQLILGEWKCCLMDTTEIRAAIPKPAEVFETLLRESLGARGIALGESVEIVENTKELIYAHASPALQDLVKRALGQSVNLYCESFLHLYGYAVNGTTNRQLALNSLTAAISNSIPVANDIILEDGSGLSPKNMISSFSFVKILQWIHQNEKLSDFWQLLPDAKQKGALSKKLKINESLVLNPRLKSGTMERVRSYSGFLTDQDKPVYAVSLMINHYSCSGEVINDLIADFFIELLSKN